MTSSETLLRDPQEISNSYKVSPVSLIQYPDKVKSPSKEILKNIDDGLRYSINYLGSGVDMSGKDIALGSNYFIKGSGKCNSEASSDKCKGKDRYVYVRNIPTGTIPPLNLSFYNATGCNLTGITEGRGLVPGLVEDVYDFNPIEIVRAVAGSGNLGSDVCKEMTLPVGSKIYNKDRENNNWVWETKCTSGHHTMTETTDKTLNEKVKSKNKHIKKARLPGPLQLRENFAEQSSEHIVISLRSILLFLSFFTLGVLCFLVITKRDVKYKQIFMGTALFGSVVAGVVETINRDRRRSERRS